MKNSCLTVLMVALLGSGSLNAQTTHQFNTAAQYAEYLLQRINAVVESSFDFYTYSVHEQDLQRANQRRIELLQATQTRAEEIRRAGAWQDDPSLNKAVNEVVSAQIEALSEDYTDLWVLRQNSNSSAEAMESYFNAQLALEEQAKQASENLEQTVRQFAQKHDLHLSDAKAESPLSRRIEQANTVNQYYRSLFLLDFKASRAQQQAMQLINGSNWEELNRLLDPMADSLQGFIQKAERIGPFDEDAILLDAVKRNLEFYLTMVADNFPVLIQVGQKAQDQLTPSDAERFNNVITDFNTQSASLVADMQSATQTFLQRHVPKPMEKTKL